mmetsp:Transcript_27293/g.41265  ORF Transcript_27293/g.41265 Transcript_27293/m.41265 type:complete len:92 (-) Transcript_27293:52-327(-)
MCGFRGADGTHAHRPLNEVKNSAELTEICEYGDPQQEWNAKVDRRRIHAKLMHASNLTMHALHCMLHASACLLRWEHLCRMLMMKRSEALL